MFKQKANRSKHMRLGRVSKIPNQTWCTLRLRQGRMALFALFFQSSAIDPEPVWGKHSWWDSGDLYQIYIKIIPNMHRWIKYCWISIHLNAHAEHHTPSFFSNGSCCRAFGALQFCWDIPRCGSWFMPRSKALVDAWKSEAKDLGPGAKDLGRRQMWRCVK